MEKEYHITLQGERRADGSVFIKSPELPLFSVVGDNEQDALSNALRILPEYLRANVPDYVDLREIQSASEMFSAAVPSDALAAHVIATVGKERGKSAGCS